MTYANVLYKCSMGEIRHQNIQAPLAAASSPLAISFSTLTNEMRPDHNTGNYMPYSLWQVCGFFYVPQDCVNCEGFWDRPTVYCPYPRRLESLTICECNYKGSTFFSVILRPWVLVRPESNSRPPAWQTDAQLTEPPVHSTFPLFLKFRWQFLDPRHSVYLKFCGWSKQIHLTINILIEIIL